jgi:hypothetical protein
MPMLIGSSGIVRAYGGSYTFTNSEASDVVAQMATPPSEGRKALIDNLVGEIKATSAWTVMTRLHVCAAHTEQAGLLDWKNPGTGPAVNTNSMTFTTDSGFTSNGTTSFLALGVAYDSGSLTQDDSHVAGKIIGTLADGTSAQVLGRADANCRHSLTITRAGAAYNVLPRLATSAAISGGDAGSPAHYYIATRRASTTCEVYVDGSTLSSPTDASVAVGTGNAQVAQSNTAFSASTVTHQVAHFGTQLSDAQAAALATAFTNYFAGL